MRPLALAALLTFAACKKEEIQVYRLAKPADSGAAAAPAAPAAPAGLPEGHPALGAGAAMGTLPPELAAAAASPSSLRWKTPGGWTEKPGSGMRRATFVVPGNAGPADLSVVSLPGDAGGALANVNRWRGQVGLAPWDESAFRAGAQTVKAPAGPFTFVDLPGSGQHMLAAILLKDGEAWFFKLLGPEQTVAAAAPAFKTFLTSVSPTP